MSLRICNKACDYPYNFLADMGVSFLDPEPEDLVATVDYFLAFLSDKERNFIKMRYKENMTLQGIADQYGMTREGVRAEIERAFAKLFTGENLVILKTGIKQYICDLQVAKSGEFAAKEYGIETLNFSARTYARLVKMNIHSMKDLMEIDLMEFGAMPGIGCTCMNEVVTFLRNNGRIVPEMNIRSITQTKKRRVANA